MTEPVLDRLQHRARSHRAALRLADELGDHANGLLATAVNETRIRLDEVEQIIAALQEDDPCRTSDA